GLRWSSPPRASPRCWSAGSGAWSIPTRSVLATWQPVMPPAAAGRPPAGTAQAARPDAHPEPRKDAGPTRSASFVVLPLLDREGLVTSKCRPRRPALFFLPRQPFGGFV